MYCKNSFVANVGQKHASRKFLSFFKKFIYRLSLESETISDNETPLK